MRSGKYKRGTETAESGWDGGNSDFREENKSSVTPPGLSSIFRFLKTLAPSISQDVSGFRCDLARIRTTKPDTTRVKLGV